MEQPRPLAHTPEVAAYVGVPVQTLYVWRTKGIGPRALRVGKYLRYRWTDVEAWLDEQADRPGAGVA